MANYGALYRALQNTVQEHTPEVIYPRYCKITDINNDTVDVLTVIGGEVNLYNLDYIGSPVIGSEGILLPTNNNFNTSVVICKDSAVVNGEIVQIDKSDDEYLSLIVNKIEKNLTKMEEDYNQLLENYKAEIEELKLMIEENMNINKQELMEEIDQKADKEHTHTFKEVYNDIDDDISYINIDNL